MDSDVRHSGTWTFEVATEWPDVVCHGVDISKTYPTTIKPSNTRFTRANVLEGLPFPDNHFDFVFQRFMCIAYTEHQWPQVVRELLRVTKPGGWLEVRENGRTLHYITLHYITLHSTLNSLSINLARRTGFALAKHWSNNRRVALCRYADSNSFLHSSLRN
jgi:ubiquinone/menaquinone biosynthesis C-methylase UbiE